jgi:transposase
MGRYRTYSIEFKRQIAQEMLSGESSLLGLSKRHGICRHLLRLWLKKYEAGDFNDEAVVASSLEEYEARIAALERKVGQLTMENDLLKKTLPRSRSTSGVNSSIVSGPAASPVHKDAEL